MKVRLLLVVFTILNTGLNLYAQNVKDILQKTYNKCQSIKYGH